MVNSFAHLRAASFIKDYPQKPYEEYGLGKDAYTISASLKDYSSTPTLYIGKEAKSPRDQWYVRAKGQDTVYLIYRYVHDSLTKTLKDIEATPTPTPSPNPSLKKQAEKEIKHRREAVSKMSEKEKKAAAKKKIEQILKKAREQKKLKPTPTTKHKEESTPAPSPAPVRKTTAPPETSYGKK